MFRRKSERPASAEEDNPFLLSFSDLMASLLAIFILALIVFMIQLSRKKDELEREKEKIKVSLAELVGSLEDLQQTQDAIASALSGVSQRESSLTAMLEGIQKDLKERGMKCSSPRTVLSCAFRSSSCPSVSENGSFHRRVCPQRRQLALRCSMH